MSLKYFFVIFFFSFVIFNVEGQVNPSNINSLVFWVTNDNYEDVGGIDTIYDNSSYQNHLHRVSSSNIIVDSISETNIEAYRFNLNSYETSLSVNDSLDNYTVICLFFPENVTSGYITDSQGSRFISPGFLASGGVSYFGKTYATDYVLTPSDFYRYTCIFDNVNGVSIDFNDSLINITSPSYTQKTLGSNLTIGSHNNNLGTFFDGQLVEYMIFNEALSDSIVKSLHNYLYEKYKPDFFINDGNDIVVDDLTDCASGLELYIPEGHFKNVVWSNSSTSDTISIFTPGTYFVEAEWYLGWKFYDTINISFPFNQIQDSIICDGDSVIWNSNLNNNYNFLWSNSNTDSAIVIKESADYWVRVENTLGCSQYSDTITISVDSFPTHTTLGVDKTICQFENLGLEVDNGGISYLWSTADTTLQTIVDTAGTYWVQVENNIGCIANDTINIALNGIAPTVNFSVVDVCENAITTFNNTSYTTDGSNIINWYWDFDNGDTSNTENPQQMFSSGVYDVVLEIETDSGCTNKLQQQITIHEKPTAGFFPTNALMCSEQLSTFTNNSFSSDGLINSWYWDFGIAGVTDTSTLENGSYIFPDGGSFNIQLISSTEYGCNDTLSQFISVKESPSASFSIQDSCVGVPVNFVNSSTGNLFSTNWDFGNFNSSTLNNPSHVYSASGIYNVELIVKDLNGCWDTLLTPITINDTPTANFISDDFCVLTSSQLFDSSTTNAGTLSQWNWQMLNTSYNSTSQHPQFIFAQPDTGIYNMKLKVVNNFGCVDSVIKTMAVHALPVPEFSFSPEIGAPPLAVVFTNNTLGGSTYEWNFGDATHSTELNPTHTYIDSNIFNVTLVAENFYGCKDSIKKSIQIIEPVVDIAVENITYNFLPNSNLMRYIVQLANYGVVAIQTLNIELYNSSTGRVVENWNGNILPNNQQLVELSSIIEMPRGEAPDVICVTATNPNNGTDVNLTNNELCKSALKFELINIYPIPVNDKLMVDYIVPSSGASKITLYNNIGKKIKVLFEGSIEKGLNKHSFLLKNYSNGIYFIEIEFAKESIRKKIMIN